MSQTVRDKLKGIREQIREKQAEQAEARKERDAMRDAYAVADTSPDVKITDTPEFKNAEEAVRKYGAVSDELADLRLAERGVLQMLGESDDADSTQRGGDGGSIEDIKVGWDAFKLLAAGSEYAKHREVGTFDSTAKFGSLQLGQIADREQAISFLAELPNATPGPVTSTGSAPLIQPDRRGVVAPILRPLRLLDLIPTGPTDSNSIEYVQVTAIPGTSAPVAEGAVKPEAGITMVDATAPVRTIAGWIKVNRQAMADAAGLATLINTLLPYDVRRKIEAQILTGDGAGQNLRGILNTSGIGAPAFVAGDNAADAILRAMTTVIIAGGEPNFAAINPLDWQDLLLMRETGTGGTRSGQYLYGGPGSMAAATAWGLTLTPSTVIAAGAPLVGDSTGVTLLVREGVNVKTSDSDQDDFVRNRVTVLAEARVALPVWAPSKFAVGDATP